LFDISYRRRLTLRVTACDRRILQQGPYLVERMVVTVRKYCTMGRRDHRRLHHLALLFSHGFCYLLWKTEDGSEPPAWIQHEGPAYHSRSSIDYWRFYRTAQNAGQHAAVL